MISPNKEPSMIEQHAVLAVTRYGDEVVATAAWGSAIGIHQGLEHDRQDGRFADLGIDVKFFCVRAVEDPRVKLALRTSYGPSARRALSSLGSRALGHEREYTRKRVGELARDAVADVSLDTLAAVIRRVREDAEREGLSKASVDAERAVKARVLVGRISTGRGYGDRGAAYFLRKKDGPLHKVTIDGHRLLQTTTSYRGSFYRLVKTDDGSYVRPAQVTA